MANSTWMVRVKHNKVSVGVFACSVDELALLVDEVCDPAACEFKPLPPGGFIFGGAVVLHELDDEAENPPIHIRHGSLTEGWAENVYEDTGDWWPIMIAQND